MSASGDKRRAPSLMLRSYALESEVERLLREKRYELAVLLSQTLLELRVEAELVNYFKILREERFGEAAVGLLPSYNIGNGRVQTFFAAALMDAIDEGRVPSEEVDALVAAGLISQDGELPANGLRGMPFQDPKGRHVLTAELYEALARIDALSPQHIEARHPGLIGAHAQRIDIRNAARVGKLSADEIGWVRRAGLLRPDDLV